MTKDLYPGTRTRARLQADFNRAPLVRPWELIPNGVRADFVSLYATRLWKGCPNGNPRSIIVSYPDADNQVVLYDIDGGQHWRANIRKLSASRATQMNSTTAVLTYEKAQGSAAPATWVFGVPQDQLDDIYGLLAELDDRDSW